MVSTVWYRGWRVLSQLRSAESQRAEMRRWSVVLGVIEWIAGRQ